LLILNNGLGFLAFELFFYAREKLHYRLAAVGATLGRQKSVTTHANSHHILGRGHLRSAEITFGYRHISIDLLSAAPLRTIAVIVRPANDIHHNAYPDHHQKKYF